MELQAFKLCNTDDEEGLTWLEVEDCEVLSKNGIFLMVNKCKYQVLQKINNFCLHFFALASKKWLKQKIKALDDLN